MCQNNCAATPDGVNLWQWNSWMLWTKQEWIVFAYESNSSCATRTLQPVTSLFPKSLFNDLSAFRKPEQAGWFAAVFDGVVMLNRWAAESEMLCVFRKSERSCDSGLPLGSRVFFCKVRALVGKFGSKVFGTVGGLFTFYFHFWTRIHWLQMLWLMWYWNGFSYGEETVLWRRWLQNAVSKAIQPSQPEPGYKV